MLNFMDFKIAVQQQFNKMVKSELFVTNVDKDIMWGTYLNSYPKGTNKIYKERTEHDCQCCKQFIRNCGNVVSIVDDKLISIWDINIGGHYQVVANALSKLVKKQLIKDIFYNAEENLGTNFNHQLTKSQKTIKWDHFYYQLPNKFVKRKDSIGTALSKIRSNKEVFKRGLVEISITSIETVLELIEQNSLYRGEEHKKVVETFMKHKEKFLLFGSDEEKDNYCWSMFSVLGIRNTVIGTLLVDISEGKELDEAVRMFESKVAPINYKRPSAVITKRMIETAQKKVKELGIESALSRRYAVTDDININNILFADRTTKQEMNVFDELVKEAPTKIKNLKKVDEVEIGIFVETILPKADSIELLFENSHINNLMSLIAPKNSDAKSIFKWGNNFSWAYKGEVADSMKERVKKAGGNVTGVLRFSIQWNDGDNNQNDFDAHCIEPNHNLIHYPKKGRIQPSSGMLDVDIVTPGNKVAVENIIWTDIRKMQKGKYKFLVHNFRHAGGKTGFTAEIEYDGQIYSYCYDKELRQDEKVTVAEIEFSKENGIKFIKSLSSTQATKEVWKIQTNKFQKVSMIMNSPNHWNGRPVGNKHYFFMLEDCKNDKAARGFFNEFLKEYLNEHRKVFEVLGSKMKTEKTNNQLSGLGFSSTQKNHAFCKVTGSFTRTIKINF